MEGREEEHGVAGAQRAEQSMHSFEGWPFYSFIYLSRCNGSRWLLLFDTEVLASERKNEGGLGAKRGKVQRINKELGDESLRGREKGL